MKSRSARLWSPSCASFAHSGYFSLRSLRRCASSSMFSATSARVVPLFFFLLAIGLLPIADELQLVDEALLLVGRRVKVLNPPEVVHPALLKLLRPQARLNGIHTEHDAEVAPV